MVKGVLAGYPLVDVKVRLVDGSTHAVDGKDIAFQLAGAMARREAISIWYLIPVSASSPPSASRFRRPAVGYSRGLSLRESSLPEKNGMSVRYEAKSP